MLLARVFFLPLLLRSPPALAALLLLLLLSLFLPTSPRSLEPSPIANSGDHGGGDQGFKTLAAQSPNSRGARARFQLVEPPQHGWSTTPTLLPSSPTPTLSHGCEEERRVEPTGSAPISCRGGKNSGPDKLDIWTKISYLDLVWIINRTL